METADGGNIIIGTTCFYSNGDWDFYLVYYTTDIPGVPISRTEIMISILILLLLAIFLIFSKKKIEL